MGQKLCIVTDAWLPQVNGVVTTLTNIVEQAERDNWEVLVLHPGLFPGLKISNHHGIKLCLAFGLKKLIRKFSPDHLHIATEGPLGLAARISYQRSSYSTAYHTQWAPFLKDILNIPTKITWNFIKWFHKNGKVMVPTKSIKQQLTEKGILSEIVVFSRGVDLSKLTPTIKRTINKKPRLLSVGRVSKEKNLDVFCQLDHKKYDLIIVGDGPYLSDLKKKYPYVNFFGMLHGSELANQYLLADCMVFTSKKDTFGLVIIESQSLGTPVAAFPVNGPIDVILPNTGIMDNNINDAIEKAILLDRTICQNITMKNYSWQNAWNDFKSNLVKYN